MSERKISTPGGFGTDPGQILAALTGHGQSGKYLCPVWSIGEIRCLGAFTCDQMRGRCTGPGGVARPAPHILPGSENWERNQPRPQIQNAKGGISGLHSVDPFAANRQDGESLFLSDYYAYLKYKEVATFAFLAFQRIMSEKEFL